jgi:virulence factor Mce-like protein
MTRQHWISLGGVLVVLVACVAYLMGGVLHMPITGRTTTVDVTMPLTGGLYEGAGVTYKGIVVGKVTDIALTDDGVRAEVRLDAGTQIPKDSSVRVRSLSPIGEQYLDFQPRTASEPFLSSGDSVTAEATDIPHSVADLSISLDKLMTQVDPAKVRTILSELSTGLSGAEADMQRLTADSLSLVDTLDDNSGLIADFLLQSRRLLRVGVDKRANIIAAAGDSATFVAWLRHYQPELYRTLNRAPGQIEEMRRLVRDLTSVMPAFLDAQGDVSEILNARDPHLRALLQDFPAGISQLADALRGGRVQIDQLLRRGLYCDYPTAERNPRDTRYRPLQEDGSCSTTLRGYSQRGAQFAPGPVQ